ncbi:hypothetical protein [Pseudoalteromonas sp. TB64]|uniref:hypothetical protein n=1 Tax=Pseudoalteromonas sp. TB64 TaxID=1938600 RepID=UPI000402823D|nr:hypothetical protein [Pseudoalteromonas sp. TB64]
MADLKKHTLALCFVGLLVLLKFILIPIMDWQDTLIAEQQLEHRKLNKTLALLKNDSAITKQLTELNILLSDITPLFYKWASEAEFKREEQQKIESQLTKYELTSKRIGWKESFPNEGASILKYSIEYAFEGDGYQVLNYLIELKAEKHLVDTPQMSFSFRGQKAGKLGIISVFIRRDYYMQLKDETNAE